MQEKEIIGLDDAQRIAERFLRGRLKDMKDISIDKTKLSQVGEIIVYDVEGVATIGGGLLSKGTQRSFKVQVSAKDSTIVGYEA